MAECRLDDALSKDVSPLSNVHRDRRPELYRRIAEAAEPAVPGGSPPA
jgi:hypothetical protein